jgi:type IV secretory pathway VirB10-like protein
MGSGPSSRHTGDVRFQDKPVINRTFEVKSERISTLRGGGGDSDSIRSSSTYLSALSGNSYGRLDDDQRVPKLMWWLAGGRGSSKGKQPTAKEMRERRKAEVENRKQVGFLGTMLGVRAPRPKRTKVEEYPADEQQDATALDGEPEMSGALPPPSPPRSASQAPELEKSLPPTPEPTKSIDAETPPTTAAAEDDRSRADSAASNRTNSERPAPTPEVKEHAPADENVNREAKSPEEAAVPEQGK